MQRSTLLAAVMGGLVSAVLVVALLLATGLVDDDAGDAPVVQAVGGAAEEAEPTVREVFERARGAIVRVDARARGTPVPSGRPTTDDGVATGSGFLIGRDGSIVTNDHVVAGGPVVTVRFRPGQKRVRARVVGRDRGSDLALLEIDRDALVPGAEPLPLGDSRSVRVGDPAIALGNPYGLDRTLTLGVVSAVHREIDAPDGGKIEDAVQTDAAINPGSSGGPLLDASGRVIGVNSQAQASGIGYAVPVDTLKRVVPRLRREARGRRN
jgi:S1-C subfamily serine protease